MAASPDLAVGMIVKIMVAGAGVPLVAGAFAPQAYDVTEGRTHRSGVLIVTYARRAD
ncbi:hypothetical protein ACFW3D_15760 [Streptomyces sp. NPDC058864]